MIVNVGGAAAVIQRSQDAAGSPVPAPAIRRPAQPVANNCWAGVGSFTATAPGTVRSKHQIAVTCSGIQVAFINWYAGNPGIQGADTPGAAALTVNAAFEDAHGNLYPLTFGGAAAATVMPGSTVISDALSSVTCTAGDIVYVRTNQFSAAYAYPTVGIAGAGCGGYAPGVNLAIAGSGSVAAGGPNFWGYGPSALLGVPAAEAPSVAVFGDSIAAGEGDSALSALYYSEWAAGGSAAGGYISRALTSAAIGHLNVAHAGEQAQGFGNVANRQYRMSLVSRRCKYAICNYGVNDVYFGVQSLQGAQSYIIAVWAVLAAAGMIVYQTTVTPSTSSTDGWSTLGGQAPTSAASDAVVRAQLNDWIRAGSPLVSATSFSPVPAGTGGALTAGQAGHPLAGYFEIAWLAESSHDAGTWTVAGVRTVTDGAMTLASPNTLTSTAAAWTAADIGKAVAVTGAGPAGAILMTSVNAVSGNAATTNDAAATAVSGAAVHIGVATLDGTHPCSYLAAQLAAGVTTSVFT